MIKKLKPFWIYWSILVTGCILFFAYPLMFIIVLPMLTVIVPVWVIIVYLVGGAVQCASRAEKAGKRIILSFLCSLLTVMIFPVCSLIYDFAKWHKFYLNSLVNDFKDMSFWVILFIHFLAFWIGEEISNLRHGGDTLRKTVLYIHGKGGSYLEAEQYRKCCAGYDVTGVDYNDYYPWIVRDQIKEAYDDLREEHDSILIIADSIGAYFAMHALQKCRIEKALFISPVLDMERLILDMMGWADVTEQELYEKGEIPTDFGETLSWKYLNYVRENPVEWNVYTEILYAEKDNLISRATVDAFVESHNAALTVMENGEHWFHTEEQIDFLHEWIEKVIR